MTAMEKKRVKKVKVQALFLTAIIYCSLAGGLLMYAGGGEESITHKVKTYFQDNGSADTADRNLHKA